MLRQARMAWCQPLLTGRTKAWPVLADGENFMAACSPQPRRQPPKLMEPPDLITTQEARHAFCLMLS